MISTVHFQSRPSIFVLPDVDVDRPSILEIYHFLTDGHPKMANRTSAINSMILSTDQISIINLKLQQTLVEEVNQSDQTMVHLSVVVANMLTFCQNWVQHRQSWLIFRIRHRGTGRIHTRYQVRWLSRVPMTHQALLTILSSHNLVQERYFKFKLINYYNCQNSQLIVDFQLIAISVTQISIFIW